MSEQQKTPMVDGLNRWAQDLVDSTGQLAGKAWPASVTKIDASGTIVTIKFEMTDIPYTLPEVTCALVGPKYIRYPIQVGDSGYVVPGDAYLGGVTGLGGGTADLTPQLNLANLVFHPTGNKNFDAVTDPQAVEVSGPNGAIIQTQDKENRLVVDSTGIHFYTKAGLSIDMTKNGLTLTFAGNTISIDANGIKIDGTAGGGTMIDGKIFLPHTHANVTPGSGNSGPVTP